MKRKYILKKDQHVIDCIFIGFLSVLINLSQWKFAHSHNTSVLNRRENWNCFKAFDWSDVRNSVLLLDKIYSALSINFSDENRIFWISKITLFWYMKSQIKTFQLKALELFSSTSLSVGVKNFNKIDHLCFVCIHSLQFICRTYACDWVVPVRQHSQQSSSKNSNDSNLFR